MSPVRPTTRSMTVIHVSDTHLGFDWPVRPRVPRPRRGEDFFQNFERVLQHAIDVDADAVIHTGDVFFRSKLPPAVVDKAYALFTRYADRGLPIVVLPGNHERSRMPPSLLLRHQHIHTLDQARSAVIETSRGVLEVFGFPYRRDARAALPELVDAAATPGADASLLAVHQAIEGSWVGRSRDQGVRFETQPDVIARKSVPDRFCALLAGHIHRRQVLGAGRHGDIPAIHCGSVERTSAQELFEPKGFVQLHLSLTSGERASVRPKFIPLPARPWQVVKLGDELSTRSALARARRAVVGAHPRGYVQLRPAERHLEALGRAALHQLAPTDVVVELRPARSAWPAADPLAPSPGRGAGRRATEPVQ